VVALIVVVEAVAFIEVAALSVAREVALTVGKQRGHAIVCAWLLLLFEAVTLVPLASCVEACFVAVAVADPLRMAGSLAAGGALVAVVPVPEALSIVALRIADAITDCVPVAALVARHPY
jgi:hypothetical protein